MNIFLQMLTKGMRDIVVARITDVPAREATPAQVWAKVGPVLEKLERDGELALLEEIRTQPGVWGLDPTLDALQLGRLDLLVVPWNVDVRVLRTPSGIVAATPEPLEVLCPGEPREEVLLRDVMCELCEAYATRLEIVSGPAEEKLLKEFGGLAGRLRW
jgi:peptide subunit release factor 1 (eRF1)